MGEAKQEEAKPEATPEEKKEEKQEEKKEEKGEEKKGEKQEEKKEEEEKPPAPPAPVILLVDLHCVGCAKKIERTIMKCRGVEGLEMDMGTNQITVKGMVDPQAICARIQKRTMREAKVISPAPAPPAEGGEPNGSEVVASQVSGLTTVELHVNMHCEACAQQLRKKILKMRGVQTAETELSSGKVTVTGTMDADRLVEYVYRRTRKQAKIVPQPPKEEEKPAEEKPAEEKPADEKPAEEKKEEEKAAAAAEPEQKGDEGGKEEKPAEGGEEQTKEGGGGSGAAEAAEVVVSASAEDDMKRMMYSYWAPVYMIERVPPPQLFSDENPNACCIS